MIRTVIPNNDKTQPFPSKAHIFAIVSAGLCAALCGCGTAKVSSQRELGAVPTGKPTTIYVSDFDLDAAKIRSEPGILPTPTEAARAAGHYPATTARGAQRPPGSRP